VQADGDKLRTGPLGGLGIGQDASRGDQIDQPGLTGGPGVAAIQPIGVGQQADLDAVDPVDLRSCGLGRTACSAGVAHPGAVQRPKRGRDPPRALVHGVVGGDRAAVVAGGVDRVGQLRRGVEGGIAADVAVIGCQRGLQMTHGQIRCGQRALDGGEHRPEVIGGGGLGPIAPCPGRDRIMDQQVPGRGQGEPANLACGRLLWPPGRRCLG
jgi:hypothetical protein